MTAAVTVKCPHCGQDVAINPTPRALSKRQAEILAFVQQSIDEQHIAPTYGAIALHFGLKSLATVNEHLSKLEEKGWIRRQFHVARSIELLHRLPLIAQSDR